MHQSQVFCVGYRKNFSLSLFFAYYRRYLNPINTNESIIKAIVYAASNAQYGEVVEYNGGRSAGICQTTYEEYDAWAQKHLSYDKYLKWRESVKDELEDYDE